MSTAKKPKTHDSGGGPRKTRDMLLQDEDAEGVRPRINKFSRSKFECRVKCDWCTDMVMANYKFWFDANAEGSVTYVHETVVVIVISDRNLGAMNTIAKGLRDYIESTYTHHQQRDGSYITTDENSDYKASGMSRERKIKVSFTIETELNVPRNESEWKDIEKPKLYRDVSHKLAYLFYFSFLTSRKLMMSGMIPWAEKISAEEDVTVTFEQRHMTQLSKNHAVYNLTLVRW